jgi:cell division protein FtsQ
VSERIQEKQKVQRRRRMSTATRRLAIAGAVVGVLWLGLQSPVFDLEASKVEVSGLGVVVDPVAIDAAVAPYVGHSLTTLNVVHLENQLAQLPGVRHATVARVWPAGLRIEITTRVPVAAIPDPAGGYVLLDDEAMRVGHIEAVPGDLPIVSIPLGEGNERILDTVIAVINELPADLRARVQDVAAPTEDSVTFQLREGPRVEWGSAEQSALKAQVLVVMLQSPQAASAGVIDVSAPTLPTTRAQ